MSVDVKKISTEARNASSLHLDEMSTEDLLITINNEDQKVPVVVKGAIPQIAKFVDAAKEKLLQGGRLIYIGAGTSGRIGLLDASECPPTFGVSKEQIMGLLAGGLEAFVSAKEGAEDSAELGVSDCKAINLTGKDCLVGIAASGRTPYVIGAINYAKSLGALTGCIVNASNSTLASIVDYPMEAVTGAEVLSGSTRMKSGTAQKLICNMISTSLMTKLGHVYQNLMVDVVATNEKLVARQLGIIQSATGVDNDRSKELLAKYGTVKLAIYGYFTGASVEEAKRALAQHQNNLTKSLKDK